MKRRGNTAAVSAPMEPPPVVVAYPTTPTPTQPSTTSKEARSSDTGTKVFPVCNYAEMKEQSTSVEELRKLCFPASFSLYEAQLELVPPGVTSASFASQSTCTVTKLDMYNSKDSSMDTCMLGELMRKSEKYSASLTKQTKSREGRAEQRWILDAKKSDKLTRLVTGCIPILKGGKILLISAGKKKEWILPKGGWEMDEELEESAIRETYEEAGVIGVLGPKLAEVHYETRKARERRLSLPEHLQSNSEKEDGTELSSGWSDVSNLSEDEHIFSGEKDEILGERSLHDTNTEYQANTDAHVVIESSMAYTHVCANLFPLYVKDIITNWPECGRLRKAVDIDEALRLLENRPEMQAMLLDLKARGLHEV